MPQGHDFNVALEAPKLLMRLCSPGVCALDSTRMQPMQSNLNPPPLQANIPPSTPAEEWPLEPLVAKLRQYCYLLADLTPERLAAEAGGDYERMRDFLR